MSRFRTLIAGLSLFFFTSQCTTAYAMPILALVPKRIAKVASQPNSPSGKTAILILDAHTYSEAQKNISELLNYFQANGVNSVGLEGADGRIDGDQFRAFPYKKSLAKAAWAMVQEGVFTGAEYF